MDKFTQFLAGFFQSKQSMMRLCLLIATVTLWGTWGYTSIVKHELQPVSKDLVTAYAIVVGGKACQSYFEKKYLTPDPSTTTPKTS
jgi:hypothetical protein